MKTALLRQRWTAATGLAMLWLALIAAPLTAWAQAGEAGAFLSTAELAGERLQLNGSGSRYKSMFRVCEAALYTRSPVRSERALHALPGAKRLHLVAARDIRAGELLQLLLRAAVEDGGDAAARTAQLAQWAGRLGPHVVVTRGGSFGFDYLPGRGTQLLINGDPLGAPVADPGLFEALMRPWLGPRPADAALKRALLGQASPAGLGQALARR